MEFVRFCIVGILCTGIDALLYYITKPTLNYQLALIIAYITSLLINYILTTYWTFKVKPSTKNLIGILGVHLSNLFIIRMGLMWLFTQKCNLSENIAYVPTLMISVLTTFILIRLVVKNKSYEKSINSYSGV
jgi:putative flippase GtrA